MKSKVPLAQREQDGRGVKLTARSFAGVPFCLAASVRTLCALLTAAIMFANANIGTSAAQKLHEKELLHVREAVCGHGSTAMQRSLRNWCRAETIIMTGGEEKWKKQADVMQGSVQFHAAGGKLVRLEFPCTKFQHFGSVAIVWSSYELETETTGRRSTEAGRVTEIFV